MNVHIGQPCCFATTRVFRIAVLVTLLMLAGIASATTTYSYTGVPYTVLDGTAYTTSMQISGSFTTNAPLQPNLSSSDIGPTGANLITSWSFSDGVNTMTQSNSVMTFPFVVSTDANGQLISDQVVVRFQSPGGINTVGQRLNFISINFAYTFDSNNNIVKISLATANAVCQSVTSGSCAQWTTDSSSSDGTAYGLGQWTRFVSTGSTTQTAPSLGLLASSGLILCLGLWGAFVALRRSSGI